MSKVKLLGINGSTRKSSTYYVLEQALKETQIAEDVDTQIISLHNMHIEGCNQCDFCARNQCWCRHQDDFTQEIMDQFLAADGYVIASPVYNMNISWKLLCFFNRFRPLHKVYPSDCLRHKVGGAIAVGGTRHGGQETAIQAIHEFYFCRQIIVVGGGQGAYSGGTVWSRDTLEGGTKLDGVGLKTACSLSRRVAQTAKLIRAGIACSELIE